MATQRKLNSMLHADPAAQGTVLQGGDGDDWLTGTPGADRLDGGGGNDFLSGGLGNDTLLGGAGNDLLEANASSDAVLDHDSVRGGDGDDQLWGGSGNDTLRGDAGNDALSFSGMGPLGWRYTGLLDGGAGDDLMVLSDARGTALGGEGNDTITAYNCGGLRLDGGAGNDVINVSSWEVAPLEGTTVMGGAGNDTIRASGGALLIDAGVGSDDLDLASGSFASAVVTTGAGRDTVRLSLTGVTLAQPLNAITDFSAGAGGDRLDLTPILGSLWWAGYDYANPFTAGWLRLWQDGADTLLQVDLSGPADGAQWTSFGVLRHTAASALTAANFVDRIAPTGALGPRRLDGGDGNDSLAGADGHDSLQGAGGDDLLDGGFGGRDTLRGGAGEDSLFGFSGNDLLDGGDGEDLAFGGSGNDTLLGGAGDDGGWWFSDPYKGRDYYGSRGLNGEAGDDWIDGGDGDDWLNGSSGNDTLLGGSGNDRLLADGETGEHDGGSDTVRGGDGDDQIYADGGNDRLFGDAGNDFVAYRGNGNSPWTVLLDGGVGNDTLEADSAGRCTVLGGDGNDTIRFHGGAGSRIEGGAGSDVIDVSHYAPLAANDAFTLIGGAGDDTFLLSGQGLEIRAGTGNDFINLAVYDNASATISLGGGRDVVRPSLLAVQNGHAASVITDFHTGAGADRDQLDLIALLPQLGLSTEADPFARGRLRLAAEGADTLLQGDPDGARGPQGWTTIAVLQGVAPAGFTQDNFIQPATPSVGAVSLGLLGQHGVDAAALTPLGAGWPLA